MHADRCGRSFDGAEINGIALVAGKNRVSHAIHGEGEGDGDNGVSNKALPVVDKVVHSFSDLRAHGRRGVERGRNLLSISKGLCICFPSVRIILGGICGVDGAHCYSRIEVRLDSGKLYKSGTPKLDLLLSISNIDSGYCGRFPRSNRGLPSCVILLPLCILLIISSKLALVGALAGVLGSNRLHGSYGRVVEIHRAVSGFLPAVPGDGIKIIVTEEVITVIPINGIGCVFLALNCLNGGLERINGSRNQLCIKSLGSCGQSRGDRLIGCDIRGIVEVAEELGSESVVGRLYKSCLILCPLSVRIRAVVSALTLLAGILAVLHGKIIVVVDKDRSIPFPSGVITAVSAGTLTKHRELNDILAVRDICSCNAGLGLPKALSRGHVLVLRINNEHFVREIRSGAVVKGRGILSNYRVFAVKGVLLSSDSDKYIADGIDRIARADKAGARIHKIMPVIAGFDRRLLILRIAVVLGIRAEVSIVRSVNRSSTCERFAALGEDKVADREDDGSIRCTGL